MTMGRGMARAVRCFIHSTQGIARMTLESNRRVLVTGATGLLGSHLAERLREHGYAVRALVRPTSRTDFLRALGVELFEGDLTNPVDCARAVDGVEYVFHSAAKVGDWGKWDEFQVGCIDATRTLATASAKAGVSRFLHISSTSAYGHPQDQEAPIDESAPLGQNVWYWDPYTWSKVECEQLLWGLAGTDGLSLTVIRPSWLFGERDRTTIPRLLPAFRAGKVLIVGPGDNPLSAVYAGTVADAAILAVENPGSRGEAYNITSHGPITQRAFLDLIADAAGTPRATRHIPYKLAYFGGMLYETGGRLRGRPTPPRVTRYGSWLLGRRLSYSTEKARTKLGWTPAPTYAESIGRTLGWFRSREGQGG
jgi:nucleoside-diphosphate-sugar epimerase